MAQEIKRRIVELDSGKVVAITDLQTYLALVDGSAYIRLAGTDG